MLLVAAALEEDAMAASVLSGCRLFAPRLALPLAKLAAKVKNTPRRATASGSARIDT